MSTKTETIFTCCECGKKFELEDMHVFYYDQIDRVCNSCFKKYKEKLDAEKVEYRKENKVGVN